MTDFRPSRFQILPVIVKNLIIINTLMAFAQFALARFGIDLADYLGLHYWRSDLFKPWQFITHMFMHGSATDVNATILHLFSNMFALWMFGSILENVWGPKRFLTFYLICGLGAAVLHLGVVGYGISNFDQAFNAYQENPTLDQFMLFMKNQQPHGIYDFEAFQRAWENDPSSTIAPRQSIKMLHDYQIAKYNEATVGASGAVFGILFAFGYLFPNTLLYLYFLVPIKAKYVVAAYALFELYAGIQNSAGDNIAHFAHLGGMLVAYIILKVWNRTVKNRFY